MSRHPIADRTTELWVGTAAFLLGGWLLWDAFEGRGRQMPRLLRPFTWW